MPFLISPSKTTKPANDTNQTLHLMSDERHHICRTFKAIMRFYSFSVPKHDLPLHHGISDA